MSDAADPTAATPFASGPTTPPHDELATPAPTPLPTAATDQPATPPTDQLPTAATDEPATPASAQAATQAPGPTTAAVDLDAIERELTAVEVALGRLADGTYWTDEVTGQTLPDSVLELDPTARRA